jgi:TRAP-type C4-dicarboxylate transport system substrate-binding protein
MSKELQVEVMAKHIAKLQAVLDAAKPFVTAKWLDEISPAERRALEQAIKESEHEDS